MPFWPEWPWVPECPCVPVVGALPPVGAVPPVGVVLDDVWKAACLAALKALTHWPTDVKPLVGTVTCDRMAVIVLLVVLLVIRLEFGVNPVGSIPPLLCTTYLQRLA